MKWLVLPFAAVVAVVSHKDAPAPAAGPAAGPVAAAPASGPPSMETLHIKFEIMNFNYYDLTKETCPEKVTKKHKKHHKGKPINPKPAAKKEKEEKATGIDVDMDMPSMPDTGLEVDLPSAPADVTAQPPWMKKGGQAGPATPPKPAPPQKAHADKAIDEVQGHANNIENQIKGLGVGGGKSGLPWMKNKEKSFLQVEGQTQLGACVASQALGETTSTECTTIMDVLRDTVKETVRGIIDCLYMQSISTGGPAPGPAPMSLPPPPPVAPASISPSGPAPASFLMTKRAAAPGPATATAPAPSPMTIGPPPRPDVNIFVTFQPGRKVGNGKSIIVEVAFLDTPGNGVDDVAAGKPFVEWAEKSGLLNHELGAALKTVTGIKPKLKKFAMTTEIVEQWDINKCEAHIKDLVDDFTLHYTRAQVPMALYNECTNFMTKMSFSHDYVLDPRDTARCRRVTRKLEHKWDYGKNTEEKDFEGMCVHACEGKYGRNAPQCNIKHGDGLLNQPL